MSKVGFKSFASVLAGALLLGQSLFVQAQLPEFTSLVEEASPAVVNISTRQKLPDRSTVQGLPDLEGFRRFSGSSWSAAFRNFRVLRITGGSVRRTPWARVSSFLQMAMF